MLMLFRFRLSKLESKKGDAANFRSSLKSTGQSKYQLDDQPQEVRLRLSSPRFPFLGVLKGGRVLKGRAGSQGACEGFAYFIPRFQGRPTLDLFICSIVKSWVRG